MKPIGNIPPGEPRLRLTTRPFPQYRYVPGVHPHPIRDSLGHSFGLQARRHAPWRPEDWARLDDWLYGVDLFNAHFFWEAHEAWEGLWAAMPRDSHPALFLQGLIQVAAAMLKAHLQTPLGVSVLAREGLGKLARVAATTPVMMGLDLGATLPELQAYFDAEALPDVARAPGLRLRR